VLITGRRHRENVAVYETFRNQFIDRGIEITVENPFITNTGYLQPLTDMVRYLYSHQLSFSSTYMGFPEMLASDKIDVSTVYGDADGYVIENNVDFNGGWSGQFKARLIG
jgi:hypothetical protein